MAIRIRSKVDDRHNIRDPYVKDPVRDPGGNEDDLGIWANTLLKTRISTLFLTQKGLKGHAEQIQCELNRLGKTEGLSTGKVAQAIAVARQLKNALIKTRKAAEKDHFPLHWQGEDRISSPE